MGMTLFAAAVLCLLLALEWSGHKYSWSNERIIVLLILSPVLFVAFSLIQLKRKDYAMLPLRILGQRSILSAALYSLALQAVNGMISYYVSALHLLSCALLEFQTADYQILSDRKSVV